MINVSDPREFNGPIAGDPVAIIGMSCLFPGAGHLAAYWTAIKTRRDAIGDIPDDHWSVPDYYDPDPKAEDKTYGRRGGFLAPVAFEPLKYGIVPNDLSAVDTTQLLGLMAADRALTDSGYGVGTGHDHRRTAVLLGVTGALKMVVSLGSRLAHPQLRRALADSGVSPEQAAEVLRRFAGEFAPWQENSFPGLLGNVTAGRIANRLNLGGANLVVDAACASSLAAVRQALMELQSGRADLVVTGGLDTFSDPFMYTCFSKTPALSPTGDVRAYDQDGDGTMLGEGLGLVVLKSLARARADGDRVYAVIRAVGAASDGKGTAIFAPTSCGQARAIEDAYAQAGFTPDTVELVEGHGTGTAVGDAVEVEALTRVFSQSGGARAGRPWCALSSVKSQIGHTKAAAGAAGLIKAALALYHKTLPPAVKVEKPLTVLTRPDSPLYMASHPRPWVSAGPRRAGVSAFGFGGSNFHCLMEEAEADKPLAEAPADFDLFAFSGPTPEELRRRLSEAAGQPNPAAAASRSRRSFTSAEPFRLILVTSSDRWPELAETAAAALARPGFNPEELPEDVFFGQGRGEDAGPCGILRPGSAELRANHFRELALDWPQLSAALNRAGRDLAALAPDLPPLSAALYPPDLVGPETQAALAAALADPRVRELAARALGQGLTDIVKTFGVRPAAEIDGSDPGFDLAAALAKNPTAPLWLEMGPGQVLSRAARDLGRRAWALDDGRGGARTLAGFLGRLAAAGLATDLRPWPDAGEAEAETGDQAAFTVMISGANYFVKKALPASSPPAPAADREKRTVLDALEDMTRETARLHQEFLNQQSEALRVIRQGLTAPSADVPALEEAAPNGLPAADVPAPAPFTGLISPAATVPARAAADHSEAARAIFRVLARETGYPVEMLHGAMDLEADLGLDSIKKVEIMAALAEEVPGLEALSAEALNGAATLGDLIALRHQGRDSWPAAGGAEIIARVAAEETGYSETVLEVVCRETGYPRDLLNVNMNLESDLGLDSIKKVEIMAALAERIPGLPGLTTDALGGAVTVRDLAALVEKAAEGAPAAAVPSAGLQPVPAPLAARPPASPVFSDADAPLPGRSPLETLLLETVAAETGYPLDLLSFSASLEGDLGLDSIKRVEIMAALSEKMGDDRLAAASADLLSGAVTLGDWRDLLARAAGAGSSPAVPAAAPPAAAPRAADGPDTPKRRGPGRPPKNSPPAFKAAAPSDPEEVAITTGVTPFRVDLTPLDVTPLRPNRIDLAPGAAVALLAEPGPLADVLEETFIQYGQTVRRWTWRQAELPVFPDDLEALILIWPGLENDLDLAGRAFKAARAAGHLLTKAAARGRTPWLWGLTFMGGRLGFDGDGPPAAAALTGLLKTLALEWPQVRTRAMDLPPEALGAAAPRFIPGLLTAAGPGMPAELGLPEAGSFLTARLAPYRMKNIRVRHIREGQTILVTGGARGVTAVTLRELARAGGPRLVILGRTALAGAEPGWMKDLKDAAAIRQALFSRAQVKPGPRDLARESARLMAEREVRNNLAALEKAGSRVTYISGDFRRPEVLTAALAEIKKTHGPIHGFIHGAGILADSLVLDKTDEDFEAVFATKARMADLILRELAKEPLNLVAFFSSSTARFGRRGQADYGAANEVLNKLAQTLTGDRQGPKCLSVNWGPWDGGMVDAGLKRLFEDEEIGLIPLAEGARLFAALVGTPKNDPVEAVVLGPGTHWSALEPGQGK